jgi:hypothetical protein
MDTVMMKKWVTYVLRPYARKMPLEKRGLLIFDNFKCHLDPEVLQAIKDLRFDVARLPANTTGELQHMDLSVNKSFKNFIAMQWEDYSTSLSSQDITKSGYFKAPSREKKLFRPFLLGSR